MLSTLEITIVRHGETEWAAAGRHTSFSDVELNANGQRQASGLRSRLTLPFDHVLVSPLKRARMTAELAGLSVDAVIEPALTEWNYGQLEGLTSDEIRKRHEGWLLFRDGAHGGESPEQIKQRVDGLLSRLRSMSGRVALVSSAHISRALAARWISLPVIGGAHLQLSTASISILGYERELPVIKLWNATETTPKAPHA